MKKSKGLVSKQDPKAARVQLRDRVILIGAPRDARRLLRHIEQDSGKAITIVGFVDSGHPRTARPRSRGRHLAVHSRTSPLPVLGGLDRLDKVVDRTRATDLVVAVPHRPRRHLLPRLAKFTNSDVTVHWVPVDLEELDAQSAAFPPLEHELGEGQGVLPDARRGRTLIRTAGASRPIKRAIDLCISSVALIALAPLFAFVSLAILLSSGRPIFYTQERVGQGGRRFRIIKFRSMRIDAEHETGPIWASDHDTRCTRIGDWLRHTNVDELPQLLNVFKGEMSLVGPRPERPVFVDQFREAMPDYDLRHAVPCGMTGWAQVHGWRGRTSLRKRLQYDLDYIKRWSNLLDLLVLLMTIQHVAWGKTSWTVSRPVKQPTA